MFLSRFIKCRSSHPYKPHTTLLFFSSCPLKTLFKSVVPTADHLVNVYQFSPETASKVSSVVPYLKHSEKTDPVLSFLKETGFSKTQLELLLQNMPKVLCLELESTITPTIKIFQELGFCPNDIAKIISSHPRILNYSEFLVPNIEFLRSLRISSSEIRLLLSNSQSHLFTKILCLELESTIKPIIKIFQELGFRPTDMAKILSSHSRILNNSEFLATNIDFLRSLGISSSQLRLLLSDSRSHTKILCLELESIMKPMIKIFQELGFRPTDIAKIISSNQRILNYSEFLVPNIDLFRSWGVSSSQIRFLLSYYPTLMLTKTEIMKEIAERVEEMGVSKKSKMFVYAFCNLGSMTPDNWDHKLDVFRGIGFSEDNIESAFRRVPYVFSVSERKVKEMTELLLGSGLYNISFIIKQPQILMLSIELRIKPRLQVLMVLQRNNLVAVKATTYYPYSISEKQFICKFVLPFMDRAPELLEFVSEAKHQLKNVGGSETS